MLSVRHQRHQRDRFEHGKRKAGVATARSRRLFGGGLQLASPLSGPDAYVFATRTGRPLAQRNVVRALRTAQVQAIDDSGRATFPALHDLDRYVRPLPVPRGAVPSMHSFRHTLVSRTLAAGETIDEVAFLIGHRDATVTRAVYLREVNDARRRASRRSRMAQEYSAVLEAAAARPTEQ